MFLSSAPRADAGDRSPSGSFWFEPIGIRTSAGVRVTSQSAMGLPAVYACVQVLAKSFALMPFCLWEPSETSRKKRPDHWLHRLFCKAPNGFQSPFEWRMMLMGHLALRGNAFCQVTSNARGDVVDLLPLHPDRMRMEFTSNGNFRYLYTDERGREIRYLRSEIWHLRWLSSDGYVGLSPIEVARDAIGEGLAMQSFASRFYVNDARPGGWVELDGRFSTDKAKQDWVSSWHKNYGGANARKVAVLEKGMKYHELKLSNADAQFVEGRARNLADIARIWGVPPHKIQDLGKSTNNNIEHQSIEFWSDTMAPIGKAWASSAEFFLLGPDSTLDVEFDTASLMRGDGKSRSERLKNLVLGGLMKPNEGRQEEGYDPAPGGDKLLRPLNMVALDENGEPEPLPEAPPATPGAPANGSGGDPNSARMMALLRGSAGRMARRIAKRDMPAAEVLASALAIETAAAAEWIEQARREADLVDAPEEVVAESLLSLSLGNKPNPMAVGATAMRQLSSAIAAMPAPVVHSHVNVAPAAVSVAPAVIEHHTHVAGHTVTLPATEIVNNITTPTPEVHNHIDVAAPVVNAQMPEAKTPVVHNHVHPAEVTVMQAEPKKAGQQDRPWPTETVIKKRDAQGRADVIETRPLDN